MDLGIGWCGVGGVPSGVECLGVSELVVQLSSL